MSDSLTVEKIRLVQDFVALRESLNSTYPEVKPLVAESSVNNTDVGNSHSQEYVTLCGRQQEFIV